MRHPISCVSGAMLALALCSLSSHAVPLTIEKIMSDPDWIGPPAHEAYWAVDGQSVYYSQKRQGSPIVDLHRIGLAGGKDEVVDGAALASADGAPLFDAAGKRAAYLSHGDVFVREVGGQPKQITRGAHNPGSLQFSADGKLLSFRTEDQSWYVHDFATGLTALAAQVRAEKDPERKPDADDMREFQLRTFSTLKRLHDEEEAQRAHAREQRKADPTRAAYPYYLGDEVVIRGSSLSPDGHWLLVVTQPKSAEKGREGVLMRYVTESGYEETEKERVRVGRNALAPQSLVLLNLLDHSQHPLPLDGLPGITDDPLKAVREENAKNHTLPKTETSKTRGVVIVADEPDVNLSGMAWSADSKRLALQIFAIDYKDRWIASVDLEHYGLNSEHRLSDAAWINSDVFNDMGWLEDNRTLWYSSEESGYGHLYIKKAGEAARALTQGHFEVTSPVLSADGRYFYMLANRESSDSYDVYRVSVAGGELKRLTSYRGVERFALDQRGRRLLITHSSPYVRSQLAVQSSDGTDKPRELTDTRSSEYRAMTWIEPEFVQVPSSHVNGTIAAKLYRPQGTAGAAHPAVLFIHGAGYLQDASRRFSYYFREQMFNNLLAQQGYVVLVLDYRASAGYGRDWRAAIYRQMGTPELEDMLDGKKWLVEHAGADPNRFGVYGGSYGGFMTLMALFRAPGEFAAGAALRPVTDWMQYDHQYTAQILNDPKIDPIAYERSSPLEFASGLKDSLLICHGVIDDNVLFEDSMRLYERLIELHKDDFTISPYPLDRHGFTNADSWLDEYKRIYRLFDSRLKH